MLTPFFVPARAIAVTNFAEGDGASNTKAFAVFFHAMLDAGVYLPPSSTRRGLSAMPTMTPPSSRPSKRPAGRSRRLGMRSVAGA